MMTIAWDVDDVLNNLTETWLATQPSPPPYDALTCNPPHALLNLSLDEYRESLDQFRTAHFAALAPNPEVLGWFQQCGSCAYHIALSAVPRKLAPVSAAWTFNHFGDWIRSYHFIPSPRKQDVFPTYDEHKGQFLARHGKVDILVEDNEFNASAATQQGVTVCLFPQPWNRASNLSVQTVLQQLTNLVHSPFSPDCD